MTALLPISEYAQSQAQRPFVKWISTWSNQGGAIMVKRRDDLMLLLGRFAFAGLFIPEG